MYGWMDEWGMERRRGRDQTEERLGIATSAYMYLPVLEVPGVPQPGVSGCATVTGPCTRMASPVQAWRNLGTCMYVHECRYSSLRGGSECSGRECSTCTRGEAESRYVYIYIHTYIHTHTLHQSRSRSRNRRHGYIYTASRAVVLAGPRNTAAQGTLYVFTYLLISTGTCASHSIRCSSRI